MEVDGDAVRHAGAQDEDTFSRGDRLRRGPHYVLHQRLRREYVAAVLDGLLLEQGA